MLIPGTTTLAQANTLLHTQELWLTFGPLFLMFVILFVAMVYFLAFVQGRRSEEETRHEKSAAAVPGFFVEYFYWGIRKPVNLMYRLGMTPNMLTVGSLILSIIVGVLVAQGFLAVAVWFLVFAFALDSMDGLLARATGLGSEAGAFLDSFIDRVVEAILFMALMIYGQGNLLTVLSGTALIASFMVSYARARGEALGIVASVGIMQRPERALLMLFALYFAPLVAMTFEPGVERPLYHTLVGATGIISVGATQTAIQRARFVMRALNEARSDAPTDEPNLPDEPALAPATAAVEP